MSSETNKTACVFLNGLKVIVTNHPHEGIRPCMQWSNGLSLISLMEFGELIQLSGINGPYDTEVPWSWHKEQLQKDPEFRVSHYVWSYAVPESRIFGQPLNWYEVLLGLGDEVKKLFDEAPNAER